MPNIFATVSFIVAIVSSRPIAQQTSNLTVLNKGDHLKTATGEFQHQLQNYNLKKSNNTAKPLSQESHSQPKNAEHDDHELEQSVKLNFKENLGMNIEPTTKHLTESMVGAANTSGGHPSPAPPTPGQSGFIPQQAIQNRTKIVAPQNVSTNGYQNATAVGTVRPSRNQESNPLAQYAVQPLGFTGNSMPVTSPVEGGIAPVNQKPISIQPGSQEVTLLLHGVQISQQHQNNSIPSNGLPSVQIKISAHIHPNELTTNVPPSSNLSNTLGFSGMTGNNGPGETANKTQQARILARPNDSKQAPEIKQTGNIKQTAAKVLNVE